MIGLASYGLLLVALVVGTLRRPAVALAAILCLYSLEQWGQSSTLVLAQHPVITNFAVAGIVALGIWLRYARGECLLCRMTSVQGLVLGLYTYAFCTLVWAMDPAVALEQWRKQYPYLIIVAGLAPLLIARPKDGRVALVWTVFVGAIICALALFFGKWGARGLILLGSSYDQEANPLAIASMGGTVVIAAALSLQRGEMMWKKPLFAVAILLGIAVILKSGSRGQLLGAAIAVLVAWPLAYPQKHLGSLVLGAAGLAAIVAVGWWAADWVQVDATRWSGDEPTDAVEGRLDTAVKLVALAAGQPLTLLFGLGNSSAYHYFGIYPHVTALEVLAEEGLVGMTLYLGVLYFTARAAVRLMRRAAATGETGDRQFVAVLVALFVFELILTMKQGSLLSGYFAFAYAMMIGRLEVIWTQRSAAVERAASPQLQPFPNLLR